MNRVTGHDYLAALERVKGLYSDRTSLSAIDEKAYANIRRANDMRTGGAMTDITERAARLLANVTPGPWEWGADNQHMMVRHSKHDVTWVIDVEYEHHGGGGTLEVSPADAAFIAAAPDLVRELLAEVTRLRGTITNLLALHRYMPDAETLAHLEKAAASYRRHGNREEAERAETFIDAVLRVLPTANSEDGE
jgi:hypothetical protein